MKWCFACCRCQGWCCGAVQTVSTLSDVYGVPLGSQMSCQRSFASRKIVFGVTFVSFRTGLSVARHLIWKGELRGAVRRQIATSGLTDSISALSFCLRVISISSFCTSPERTGSQRDRAAHTDRITQCDGSLKWIICYRNLRFHVAHMLKSSHCRVFAPDENSPHSVSWLLKFISSEIFPSRKRDQLKMSWFDSWAEWKHEAAAAVGRRERSICFRHRLWFISVPGARSYLLMFTVCCSDSIWTGGTLNCSSVVSNSFGSWDLV